MISFFYAKIRYALLALLPIILLNACGGINLRVFPLSTLHNQDIEAVLEYEPTKCIPFVSCQYSFNILSGSFQLNMDPNREIVVRPNRITDQCIEFSNITTELLSPGKYVLKGITVKHSDYSYRIDAIIEGKDYYCAEDAKFINMEKPLRFNYKNNMDSFTMYHNKANSEDIDGEDTAQGKIPLRLAYDRGRYSHDAISIPLPPYRNY